MSAPTPTARVTPDGIMLEEGFSIKIVNALDPDIRLWEQVVGLPGLDGGEAIDITTQFNTTVETFAPRKLIAWEAFDVLCGYDPKTYDQLMAVMNKPTTITEWMPDGSTLAYYGFYQRWRPAQMQRGTQPQGTLTVMPTNWDSVNKVEELPVLYSAEGT